MNVADLLVKAFNLPHFRYSDESKLHTALEEIGCKLKQNIGKAVVCATPISIVICQDGLCVYTSVPADSIEDAFESVIAILAKIYKVGKETSKVEFEQPKTEEEIPEIEIEEEEKLSEFESDMRKLSNMIKEISEVIKEYTEGKNIVGIAIIQNGDKIGAVPVYRYHSKTKGTSWLSTPVSRRTPFVPITSGDANNVLSKYVHDKDAVVIVFNDDGTCEAYQATININKTEKRKYINYKLKEGSAIINC